MSKSLLFLGISQVLLNSISAEQLPFPIFHRLLKNSIKREIVHETKCDQSQCYQIYDMLFYRDYSPQVFRQLGFPYPSDILHSSYELSFPTDLSIENLDTKNWKVRKTFIEHDKYFVTMSEAPFWSGLIPRNSTENHNFLLIGVAGGNMNNYWAATYPQVNITAVELNPLLLELGRRWFSLDFNERHRVFIEDGSVFVTNAVERGEHYDVIVLDATYDDPDREVMSPVDVFRRPEIIRNMEMILEPNGILFINLIIGEKTESRLRTMDKVVQEFNKIFKFVEIFHSEDFNSIMMCRQIPFGLSHFDDLPKIVKYIQ